MSEVIKNMFHGVGDLLVVMPKPIRYYKIPRNGFTRDIKSLKSDTNRLDADIRNILSKGGEVTNGKK